jgi:ribosome biogenesis GTPase / thiamine phosphate phosphatase
VPLAEAAPTVAGRGRVLRARGGFYRVLTDDGSEIECAVRGRLKQRERTSNLVAVGDRVLISRLPAGPGGVEEVEERRSTFSRRQPGYDRAWREDVLVANLDQALIVFACTEPEPHRRMIDRFLVVAEHNEVPAVLVANKTDLIDMAAARRIFDAYQRVGYPVLYTSARSGDGVEELRKLLAGRTSVVTGPSGVGKSSLLNAVQPGLRLATAEVSEALHKGRHTTVEARLLRLELPAGGWVADTPGLREIGLWQVPPDELAWCFPEFRPHLGACGFNDCRHLVEPRCAVLAAVERGDISPERHDSYRRLVTGD